jgi:twitching motility protein PilJ
MNSTSKLLFSSLKNSKNWPGLFAFIVLFALSLEGLALIATGFYTLIYPNLLFVVIGVGVLFILSTLAAINLCFPAIQQLKVSLDKMELQNRHNQDAILR